MPQKLIYHAPKYNPKTQKWDVEITDAATGAPVRTEPGFATKQAGHDYSQEQVIAEVTAAGEKSPDGKKTGGRSTLSL